MSPRGIPNKPKSAGTPENIPDASDRWNASVYANILENAKSNGRVDRKHTLLAIVYRILGTDIEAHRDAALADLKTEVDSWIEARAK